MTTPSPPLVASRLEKAASDNGFDLTLGREADWLAFTSSQTSLRVWLATFGVHEGAVMGRRGEKPSTRRRGVLGRRWRRPGRHAAGSW
jgi:hypothetical protein